MSPPDDLIDDEGTREGWRPRCARSPGHGRPGGCFQREWHASMSGLRARPTCAARPMAMRAATAFIILEPSAMLMTVWQSLVASGYGPRRHLL